MPKHHHVCPWWMGYFLLHPFRRFRQNPAKILSPYVREGMTLLEIGPGMGYFTIPLARMVGPQGRVVSVDIQEKMIVALSKRATRAGLLSRIETRVISAHNLGITDLNRLFDFALAFAVVHEVPDQESLFRDLHAALKVNGVLLMADPRSHFSREEYDEAIKHAVNAGFGRTGEPEIWNSRAAVLRKIG